MSDPAEIVRAGKRLGLSAEVVERAGTRYKTGSRVRPHVEHLKGGGVHLTAPTLTFRGSSDDVLTGEVTCLVMEGVVITAETGSAGVLDRVAERLTEPQATLDNLTGGVLSALWAILVESAADVEGALGDAVTGLEDAVFDTTEAEPVERIYALKREIAEARRALVPLAAELPELVIAPDETAPADAWVRRLVRAVDRLDRRLAAHDSLLVDMLSAHLALISLRQNETIRLISAWAAIVAVPTLIASIYGMNFRHMPELSWTWAYPAVIGLMVALSVVLFRLFRRSGWL